MIHCHSKDIGGQNKKLGLKFLLEFEFFYLIHSGGIADFFKCTSIKEKIIILLLTRFFGSLFEKKL